VKDSSKMKTVSLRLEKNIYKEIKKISVYSDITIQNMGEVFVELYLADYLNPFQNKLPQKNQKKLYRNSDESTLTFRIEKEVHNDLRKRLKEKRFTFQQIAESFFVNLVEKNIKIDINNSKFHDLPEKYKQAIYVFENPYG